MQLIPSPDKCKALLVSSWNKEWKMELGIKLGKSPIETVKKTTLLGVEFDQGMTFKEHINKVCTKTTKRNNAIKAISSKSQGLQKEELRTVYKALTRSVFNYACPAWTPHISETNWTKMERKKNQALRTMTGCVQMTSADHLRQETNILPVKEHCKMLTSQLAAETRRANHPCSNLWNLEEFRRQKTTLKRFLEDTCNEHDVNMNCKDLKDKLHTSYVKKTIEKYEENKLLKDMPPKLADQVAELEKHMTRSDRTFLAQMRSSYCSNLAGYLKRIGATDNSLCRKCKMKEETAEHVIRCIGDTEPEELWTSPEGALEKLRDVQA